MAQYISIIFLVLIALLLIKSLINRHVNYKSECVSLGILGTFIGISIGLFNFDTHNISHSIPVFLDGLKTAFITSGAGISASTILSILSPVEEDTLHLQKLIELQKENNEIVANVLNDIKDSTAKNIVENLRKVVGEFNENIEEQFGENFKQLNSSIVNLIKWQENYKAYIELYQENVEIHHQKVLARLDSLESIENTKIDKMELQSQAFIDKLNAHYSLLAERQQDIKSIITGFEQGSLQITDSLANNVQRLNKQIAESVTIAEENLTTLIGVANGKLSYA